MKTHSNFASRILGILAIAATVGWLQPTAAYGQTAENTIITNTATVSFSDATWWRPRPRPRRCRQVPTR